jgi:hypothetical protein
MRLNWAQLADAVRWALLGATVFVLAAVLLYYLPV